MLSQDSLQTTPCDTLICYTEEQAREIARQLIERRSLLKRVDVLQKQNEFLKTDVNEFSQIIDAQKIQLQSKDIIIDNYKLIENSYKKELRRTKMRSGLTIGGLSLFGAGLGATILIISK